MTAQLILAAIALATALVILNRVLPIDTLFILTCLCFLIAY
jgi:hypothetical protein